MPNVRALLDTSMFTCGQYRPAGSEQTLQVALGRDVQRDLGRVPQRIGVRVAMTEETATLLCADNDSGGRGFFSGSRNALQGVCGHSRCGRSSRGWFPRWTR
ncbi:hypothetical protein LMJF_31_1850 [Leishmania major strain Friedlin]|uniref:Uncharacterized protein n=1 Tax=Leishmania major TaxID=5664 RepID=Q4Q677_LEIMA|nr:hypothetical protein LMJF_31_1850 [Leishmania major strain Friedlin]CAG9579356.1 hypothetical_protein_-_conserved [Leishmania major strain Friedlin]CAJ08373.1 hypothetical protein LMJF_31_1850 [Leishmania major strain Friedlin]|eukprot:XP_001685171.1 hypothetical protein LMJF_31_1850 [Leishmania major strain Friedlin]